MKRVNNELQVSVSKPEFITKRINFNTNRSATIRYRLSYLVVVHRLRPGVCVCNCKGQQYQV